ncbi:hypothetical protein [Bacillus cereus group sp. FL70]
MLLSGGSFTAFLADDGWEIIGEPEVVEHKIIVDEPCNVCLP